MMRQRVTRYFYLKRDDQHVFWLSPNLFQFNSCRSVVSNDLADRNIRSMMVPGSFRTRSSFSKRRSLYKYIWLTNRKEPMDRLVKHLDLKAYQHICN